MSRFIQKSRNVSVLLYHIVRPAKYRRVVFHDTADRKLKEIRLGSTNVISTLHGAKGGGKHG